MKNLKYRLFVLGFILLGSVLFFQNCGELELSNQLSSKSSDTPALKVESTATSNYVWRKKVDVNFNKHNSGLYNASKLKSDFGQFAVNSNRGISKTGSNASPLSKSRVSIIKNGFGGSKSARFKLYKNKFGFHDSGASFEVPVIGGNRYKLTMKMRLSKNFEGKGGKIIGFRGGYEGTGGRPATGKNGFSARINWWRRPTMDTLVSYTYHMNTTQRHPYGDAFYWNCSDQNYCSYGTIDIKKIRGQWIDVVFELKINSVGKKNGFVKVKYNGKTLSHQKNLEFRRISSLKIDKLYVNVFAGGNDPSFAPKQDMHIDLDNIRAFRYEKK